MDNINEKDKKSIKGNNGIIKPKYKIIALAIPFLIILLYLSFSGPMLSALPGAITALAIIPMGMAYYFKSKSTMLANISVIFNYIAFCILIISCLATKNRRTFFMLFTVFIILFLFSTKGCLMLLDFS
jgi:hypothetical protein